ncbi:MAG: hypothetical protein ACW98X_14545 [Promethearchaeota archaeon]|jgi:hypothetical protein
MQEIQDLLIVLSEYVKIFKFTKEYNKKPKEVVNLTESIKVFTPDLKGVIYIPRENIIEFEPKRIIKVAPFMRVEPDLIERKRELKRWKKSFSYYSLHPDKFRFGIRSFN